MNIFSKNRITINIYYINKSIQISDELNNMLHLLSIFINVPFRKSTYPNLSIGMFVNCDNSKILFTSFLFTTKNK